tara:strand:- start:557 stop:1027 length:471 start_codon:yes stop_codon:yes gene_type:complete
MKNIILIFTFFIFFGCVTNRSFDNELKIKTSFTSKNIFPVLKVLREYELLEQDYYYYKGKKRSKNIEDKKRDINYIKSLTRRYDEWNSTWETSVSLNGKIITLNEWKILNRALNEVFGDVNNSKALNMLINHDVFQIQLDSLMNDFDIEQNYSNNL